LYDYTWAWRTDVAAEAVSALVQSTRQLAREMASGDVVRMLFEDSAYASGFGGGSGGGNSSSGRLGQPGSGMGSAASLVGDHAGGAGAAGASRIAEGHRSGMEGLLHPHSSIVGVLFHQLEAATPAADDLAADILAQATRRFAERYAGQLERLASPTAAGARGRAEAEEARRAFHDQSRDFDVVLHDVIAAAAGGSGNVLPFALPAPAAMDGSGGGGGGGPRIGDGSDATGSSSLMSGGSGSAGGAPGAPAPTMPGGAASSSGAQPVRASSGLSLRSIGAVQVTSPVGTLTPTTERPVLLTPQPQAAALQGGGGGGHGRGGHAGGH
jgi:plasmid stabilization system protein ParE